MGGAAGGAGAAVEPGAEGLLLLGERLQQLLDVLAAAEDALPDPRDEAALPPLLRGWRLRGQRRPRRRVGRRRVPVRHADRTGRDGSAGRRDGFFFPARNRKGRLQSGRRQGKVREEGRGKGICDWFVRFWGREGKGRPFRTIFQLMLRSGWSALRLSNPWDELGSTVRLVSSHPVPFSEI